MAKTLVIDSAEGTRVPFLRGILTRSLHEAGLNFQQAYRLSSLIRRELAKVDQITTQALRTLVAQHLGKSFDSELARAYSNNRARAAASILVHDPEGQVLPFSLHQHMRCLEATGLSEQEAVAASSMIYQQLLERGIQEISSAQLRYLTYEHLRQRVNEEAARRFLVWVDYQRRGQPLILLIGGITGSGKSTVATELAHRLDVVRTQSTDMLREVMRMMMPERLSPVLHQSSFTAWKALRQRDDVVVEPERLIAEGYMSQLELLSLPCEAVIQRALKERVPLILEGVHVHPMLVEALSNRKDAIILPIMLAVLKPNKLRKRLRGRQDQAPGRSASHYLEHFEQIWMLQSFLLSEADRKGVPIVSNSDKDKTVTEVLRIIIETMAKKSTATPEKVFGHIR